MCVILVCPKKVRPDRKTLEACHRANPHGAGVAWRENDEVRWLKGLDVAELAARVRQLPGEIVLHFRIASVGEVTPALCHPFPVSAKSTTRLSGHARAVVFHNGTWPRWHACLASLPHHLRPEGPMSDTRVAALLVNRFGPEVLGRLPGRWVFFERDFTLLHGEWRKWRGMRASNLFFLNALPSFAPRSTQSAYGQRLLDFADDDGTWNP